MDKGLFNKIKSMTRIAESVEANAVSRISEGTTVNGRINCSGDIRVDGFVEGRLYSEGRVVVGEKASIEGTVFCNDLDLWGSVNGEIFVRNLLSLKGTSSVQGDIHVRRLQVEMGAEVNGTCKMISEEDFDSNVGDAGSSLPAEPGQEA